MGPVEAPPARPPRALALALHPAEAARQGFEYPPDPAPLRALGATHVVLAPTWTVAHVRASEVAPGEVADPDLRAVIRRAHSLGLGVLLLPHLVLSRAEAGHWRGALAPRDETAFFRSYARFVEHYAGIAREEGVEALAIGSELTSLTTDRHRSRWRCLGARARGIYGGALVYVSNHDALDRDAAFESVDVVGVSAYFSLTDEREASLETLRASWRIHARELRALAQKVKRPLWIAELGYPSRDGAAIAPWDDTTPSPADPEEQRRAFEAARLGLADEGAFGADGWLAGLGVWTFFGPGGRADRHYTPFGKPAADEVKELLGMR